MRAGGWNRARLTDWLFQRLTFLFALTTMVLILGIAVSLYWTSRDSLHHMGLRFFTTTAWDPVAAGEGKKIGDIYGVLPFVYGTVVTAFLSLLIAVPLGLGAAIFLSEIAPRWLSTPLSFLVELLAAVPSIVYGFAALQYLVPLFQTHAETWLNANFGHIPFFALPGTGISGQDFIVASIILSVMVLPFVTAIARDVLRTVPNNQREAAYGMGATRWEVIRGVLMRYGSSGIIGAVMLGLGRAVGETMAVTIVIGNFPSFPKLGDPTSFSLFRPGSTMPSVLATQYPSPNSNLHLSALTEVALTLFGVTILINALARGLVWLTAMRPGASAGVGSDWQIALKSRLSGGLRYPVVVFVSLLFLYQTFRDLATHGARGLFGGAELIGLGLLALVLFNRRVPTTRFFLRWRRICNGFALILCTVCVALACSALISLLFFVMRDGLSSLNAQFFRPPDPIHPDQGGMLHAIVGTGLLLAMASGFGIPLGVMGGLYLAEFGNNRIGGVIRFATDLLTGVPSIVVGIFAFTLIVLPTRNFFGIAGGFALGVMMLPAIMRTTEELVRLVPQSLREGSLALGATHARTVWQVVLPSARSGILTGVLVAIARVAGETAPLLIAVGTSSLWQTDVRSRLASIPVQIYYLSDQPGELALRQSWGATLVLVTMVLVFSILARIAMRDKMKMVA
jgi:phosphate transport system permease protein